MNPSKAAAAPDSGSQPGNWQSALSVYADWRMAKILLLGFVSGFPWLLIGAMLTLWLKEEGFSRTSIGLFTLMFTVYAVNALWAPVVDGVRVPWLSRRFGRRTGWILAMQAVIAGAVLFVAALPDATGHLWFLAGALFVVAVASATQDVAIDALRIEMIAPEEGAKVGAGSAMATSGWWLGMGGSKALALPLVQWLQDGEVARAWQMGYLIALPVIAACVALLIFWVREVGLPAARHPAAPGGNGGVAAPLQSGLSEALKRAGRLYIAPVVAFAARYGLRIGAMLIAIIFLFKIGEAFLGRMSLVFYQEVGFSKNEIGLVSGGLGTFTICVFAILGSFVNARYGLFRGIVLGGIAMAVTNLLFAALAWHPEEWLFVFAVVADQFTTAVSTVAFVAFLSQLCDRAHTATQYAALASLGNLSRTTLAATSGIVVDALGGNWPLFFVLTTAMVLPSLIMLMVLRRPLAPLFAGATTKVI